MKYPITLLLLLACNLCYADSDIYQYYGSDGSSSQAYVSTDESSGRSIAQIYSSDGSSSQVYSGGGITQIYNSDGSSGTIYGGND